MSGHSVLQFPVPPLDEWVRARTAHHDKGFVSSDPRFGHAHITALGPFDDAPDVEALDLIAEIAATTVAMTVRLARLDQFPNGIIHLRPVPDGGLREVTSRLVAAFPTHLPYGGEFGPVVEPHLTLDAAGPDVSLASTRRLLEGVVPLTCELTELQLAWWETDNCHVLHVWPLG